MKRWYVRHRKANYNKISKKFGINNIITKILVNRGIICEDLINMFINPELENLHDPTSMKDIEKATDIIINKINLKSKIRIIGDYDVDGVVSSYILYMALIRCGANVDYEIPDRVKDGYGISIDMINDSKKDNIDTIITCDNGIAAIEAIAHAKGLGLTVIVTDHHEVPFVEDEEGKRTYIKSLADAIVNPKQEECKYKFKNLCGAGVAFKLIQVLYENMEISKREYYKFVEFVAIATVCDVVDLVDENRIFVKNGLEMINKTENIGLKELLKQNNISDKNISTYHLGFIIGPCINASGRLDTAKKGLELLITNDKKEAEALASELYKLNQERKSMTEVGVEKAIEKIENTDIKNDKVFVIDIDNTHESLAGIIAGRIREAYNVPTIVLTKLEDKDEAKGSGRSIDCYNMFEELFKCKDLLIKFGGHPMAAGLSLKGENIEPFRKRINELTKLTEEDLIPKITLDMQLQLDYITYDLIYDLQKLEPFGKGNGKPLFGAKDIKVLKADILGKNKNVLKLRLLSKNNKSFEGICFRDIETFDKIVINKYGDKELEKLYRGVGNNVYLDIAFYPEINEYNGNVNIQLVIQDFR